MFIKLIKCIFITEKTHVDRCAKYIKEKEMVSLLTLVVFEMIE